jgi:hypothetical protein
MTHHSILDFLTTTKFSTLGSRRGEERRGEPLANGEHSSLALNFILGITTRAHDGYRKFLKIGLHMIF